MKYLIVTGGALDEKFVVDVIKNGGYEVIIAVDSGMDFCYNSNIMPDVIVGDFDSVGIEALNFFQSQEQMDIHKLNPEKDDTDTEYALRFAIERGATRVTVLGGTGSRIDHVLGNISMLGVGMENNVFVELLDAHNKIRMINSSLTIKKEECFGKYVSICPISEKVVGVTITGVKYPLDNYDMYGFNTLGISNEIVDDEATISIKDGILLVIESND